MKMRTFYKKLPLFIKNCPLLFIKNSMLQIVIYKKLNFWEEYTPLPPHLPQYHHHPHQCNQKFKNDLPGGPAPLRPRQAGEAKTACC